jgi:SET domain-containing protein
MRQEPYQPVRGVDIKPVVGKGRGVIATRKFRAGEIIETAPALLVPKDDLDALAKTFLSHYLFTTDNRKNVVIGLGITSMLNHDDDANAEFFVTHEQITIKARRSIASGSEITLNYRWGDREWSDAKS